MLAKMNYFGISKVIKFYMFLFLIFQSFDMFLVTHHRVVKVKH